ncbi:sugar transferase [Devosia sp.]|uniref:sugar transferase n=1 Tax=Devosia sp. TaxID=1871048 RepID=UPI002F1058FA
MRLRHSTVLDTLDIGIGLLGEAPQAAAATGDDTVTWCSGLPARWRDGWPAPAPDGWRRRMQLIAKRGVDIALAGGALLALALPMAAVALAIRLTSPGPVLFRQERLGHHGRPFTLYKFRTLHVEAEDRSGLCQPVDGDGRVTRIGAWLRRRSLDELPQLINVLKGEMSLVGPRPHVAGMRAAGMDYRDLVPWYDARHQMKPGLSGWAQANGYRGPTDDAGAARARIAHNIAYIQNFSLVLDVVIICRTLKNEILRGTGS